VDANDVSQVNKLFVATAGILQVAMIVLYMACADYNTELAGVPEGGAGGTIGTVSVTYSYYTDVAVMIFIGFGFLMTFLQKYAYSALGYTFLVSVVTIEMTILAEAFVHALDAGEWHTIMIDVQSLVKGLFAAGAVMISFGAVLGRTAPMQLLAMGFCEVIFYAANEWVGAGQLRAVDMGGSMFVHEFGAFFGLAVAFVLGRQRGPKVVVAEPNANNASRYDSDISAMVGTIFLWILWPSFNGALAPTPDSQMRVVINTVMSLCGSVVAAFVLSHLVRKGKFNMVHIQNATLAGGVAIGSSSDLTVGPGGSMLVGTLAGAVSVLGYEFVSPWLERRVGLQDTCGVNNLHGIPGLIGALTGMVSCALADDVVYGVPYEVLFSAGRSPRNQVSATQHTGSAAVNGSRSTGTALTGAAVGSVAVPAGRDGGHPGHLGHRRHADRPAAPHDWRAHPRTAVPRCRALGAGGRGGRPREGPRAAARGGAVGRTRGTLARAAMSLHVVATRNNLHWKFAGTRLRAPGCCNQVVPQLDGRPGLSMAFGIVRNHDLCSNSLSYELNTCTYLTIL
jgi:ammonium transporter Rh